MKRWIKFIPVMAGALAFAANPVSAAEAKSGLPQLDLTLYPGQLFWLAISFGALYFLMSRVALPAVQIVQAKRQALLKQDLDKAAKASEAARQTQASYEKSLADARTRAMATVSVMAATAAKEAVVQQTAQQAELQKNISEAEGKINTARDEALKKVDAMAQDLAKDIVAKVTKVG